MGINIEWINKHAKEKGIEEIGKKAEMHISDNKASVDKHTNTTNLIGTIAKAVVSLAAVYKGDSNKEE